MLDVPDDPIGSHHFLRAHGFECGPSMMRGYVSVRKDGITGISKTWIGAYIEWFMFREQIVLADPPTAP